MSRAEHRTRLVLDLRGTDLGTTDVTALTSAGNVACALLPAQDDPVLRSVTETLQAAAVAVLVENDVALAKAIDADGVHLPAGADVIGRYAAARAGLDPDRIIGAEAVAERHDLMVLAESGVDYIAFPVPAQRDELLWWAEIFEVPCIGLGEVSSEDAATFASKGVEFVSASAGTEQVKALELAVADIAWPEV